MYSKFKKWMPSPIQHCYHKTLLNRAKQIFSFNEIFYNELKDNKQTLLNNGFSNNLLDEEIKLIINVTYPWYGYVK